MAKCPFAHGQTGGYAAPAIAQPKVKPKAKAQAQLDSAAQSAADKAKAAQKKASAASKAAKAGTALVAMHPDVLTQAAADNKPADSKQGE